MGVQATAYPQQALDFYKHYRDDLGKLDNGQSHSNVYHWIITRNHATTVANVPSTLKLVHEGQYDIASNSSGIRDTVTAYLRSIVPPFAVVDSARSVVDSLLHSGSFLFQYAVDGTYYVQLRHRNSLETWSRSGGEAFLAGEPFTYDFTSSLSQAYMNNLKQVDGVPERYALISGDVNQDGIIDAGDLSEIDNASALFTSGYTSEDLNGDYLVDATDAQIASNNAAEFRMVERP